MTQELFISDLPDSLSGGANAGAALAVAPAATREDGPTTLEVAEEEDVTTLAVGEEGDDEPTTLAVGEEGDEYS
jgi:hypothetical protein